MRGAGSEAAGALLKLFSGAPSASIRRGTRLVAEGAPADALFLVLSGRFDVVVDGARRAEIGRGETIGEIAFFAEGRRTADVIAARDGEVLVLDADTYRARIAAEPNLLHGLLRMMALRLDATTHHARPPSRSERRNIVVLAAGQASAPHSLFRALALELGTDPGFRAFRSSNIPGELRDNPAGLARFLDRQERKTTRLLLLLEPDAPVFAAQALASADAALIVAAGPPAPRGDLEQRATAMLPEDARLLVVERARAADPIRDTALWLDGRHVRRHHHVASDDPRSIRRLARFLSGRALGLVLSGGGAFGAAHVGVYRALAPAGLAKDAVGGTSVGAAIAMAIAAGLSPDEIMAWIEEIFVRGRAMGRYTLPVFSVLDHHNFDARLLAAFGDNRLEDLALPVFAVSASLSDHAARVTREGRAFDAVRASAAVPGLLPPYPFGGHLHVDGAIVDNVPVAAMRALKEGPNVVVAFPPDEDARLPDYAGLPGRFGTLFRLIARRAGTSLAFPSLAGVLTRSLLLTSRARLKALDLDGDLLVAPPVPASMGLLDWRRAREVEQIGFEAAAAALANGGAEALRERLDGPREAAEPALPG